MYCQNCGQKAGEKDRFCNFCGKPLPVVSDLPLVPVKLVDAADLPPVPVKLVDAVDLPPVPVKLVDAADLPPVVVKLADEKTDVTAGTSAEIESEEDIQESIRPPEKDIFRIRFALHNGLPYIEVQPPGSRKPLCAPFTPPYDAANRAGLLSQLQEGSQSTNQVVELHMHAGSVLLNALISDPAIRKVLSKTFEDAYNRQRPLVVQMCFNSNAVDQAQLPWELLYDGRHHLSLAKDIYLNRYVTYFGDRQPFAPVEPVRALFVIARPNDQDDLPLYERDAMVQALNKMMRLGKVEITILEQATLANFAAEVQTGKYHIVHFDGHGGFGSEGSLCFENLLGGTDSVSASQMAEVLQNSGVRLVVLSACKSATIGGNSVFNSTAPALIRAKIPAVVAHQFSIPFSASLAFVQALYTALGKGASISAAVADGRQAIARDQQTPAVWFYPVLYLRAASGDGYLFSESPMDELSLVLHDLAEMALEWAEKNLEDQLLYPEGQPTWQGGDITPDNYLDLLDQLVAERLPNSVTIPEVGEMVLIPGGEVVLGSSEEQIAATLEQFNAAQEKANLQPNLRIALESYEKAIRSEGPQHSLHLRSYYIARRPLDFRCWWKFVQEGGYQRREFWRPSAWRALQQESMEMQQITALEKTYAYLLAFQTFGFGFSPVNEQRMWDLRLEFARKMISNPDRDSMHNGTPQEWQAYLRGLEQIYASISDPQTGKVICPWIRWLLWGNPYWANTPLAAQLDMKTINAGANPCLGYPHVPTLNKADPDRLPTAQRFLELNPFVVLNYEEAIAYCKWASSKSIERHGTNAAYYTLAYETEWEKAARGSGEAIYPWGDEYREEIANGQNGSGASPYGVEAMCSGNPKNTIFVSVGGRLPEHLQSCTEWTASLFKPYPINSPYEDDSEDPLGRVVRGNDMEIVYLTGTRTITCRCAGTRSAWMTNYYPARVRITSRSIGALAILSRTDVR